LDKGYLTSPSPKGPLRLDFPNKARPFLFPELYPAGSSADVDRKTTPPQT